MTHVHQITIDAIRSRERLLDAVDADEPYAIEGLIAYSHCITVAEYHALKSAEQSATRRDP